MAAMSADESPIGITVEPSSEPIAGSIRLANGATERFEGYLQLIAALECARGAGPNPTTPANPSTHSLGTRPDQP
jgi:hypothetical protein